MMTWTGGGRGVLSLDALDMGARALLHNDPHEQTHVTENIAFPQSSDVFGNYKTEL